MIQPKNETEDLLLSTTKNSETRIEQPQTKPEETLKFKMIKPRESFRFNPPIQINGDWMIGLTGLEVYNSFFNITEINNKYELYTGFFEDDFSYTQLKDKVAEVLGLSDVSPEGLKPELFGPKLMEIYRKLLMEKSQIDGYYSLLKDYFHSPIRDFEIYLRSLTGLNEDYSRLISRQYKSKFVI